MWTGYRLFGRHDHGSRYYCLRDVNVVTEDKGMARNFGGGAGKLASTR